MKNYRCPECGEDMRTSFDIYGYTYWYCMREKCLVETYNLYELKEQEDDNG